MKQQKILLLVAFFIFFNTFFSKAQKQSNLPKEAWVDSVFNALTKDQRIAQLMVIRAHSNLGQEHINKVVNDIEKYNVGALCFFQGGPLRQANLTNYYQRIAATPLMVTIDGEWGLGMRLDSVLKFPYQLTLGALTSDSLVYKMGLAVGEQCKRIGVHVNYAPVVDINNNPLNPVIGFRSFGEDKEKVSRFGVAYMKGMQDAGIMACAKHFPGHGDVAVDSHLDLPVINKSRQQLDTLELVPFKALIKENVGSVMVAHLSIPAIDSEPNRASSISKNNVNGLLRKDLGFNGLVFTDALEMKGVAKYFPGGTIAVEALIAGNDMLCLPASVPDAIEAIKIAIKKKRLTWKEIDEKVKKVLASKYDLGLNQLKPIETNNLLTDINNATNAIREQIATQSITIINEQVASGLLKDSLFELPVFPSQKKKVAYVGIGVTTEGAFAKQIKKDLDAQLYFFPAKGTDTDMAAILKSVQSNHYDVVLIGIHNYSNRPSNNYDISKTARSLWQSLNTTKSATFTFGNVLSNTLFCEAKNLIACYQDDDITQLAAAQLVIGKYNASGQLPVRVCGKPYGYGLAMNRTQDLLNSYLKQVDLIVQEGIDKRAYPGCVVLALQKGEPIYFKAFGKYTYNADGIPMKKESIFDLASVTKISATNMAIMHLYEEGKLDLNKMLADYLPYVKKTNKANIKIEDLLLHQAGLIPFIKFYEETLDPVTKLPSAKFYASQPSPAFPTRVTEKLYLKKGYSDVMMKRILQSDVLHRNKYVYSDNDFIFLAKVAEAITGKPINQYVKEQFYDKLGMATTGYKPYERFSMEQIVPTEDEKFFRHQLIQGDVHDEGAAMMGSVAGHAGLFSNAWDLSRLYQMLLNGGVLNGVRYFQDSTIKKFTSYQNGISRRGLGFDKPEPDNATRPEPYPCITASPLTYGHTGFTGTCVWVDPAYDLVYIFLSNRVYPTRDDNRLSQLNIRPRIQELFYRYLGL